jgi:hypothetical protein
MFLLRCLMSISLSVVEKRMKGAWVLQDEHYLATVLHPKLKHLHMGAPGDREKAVELLNLAI